MTARRQLQHPQPTAYPFAHSSLENILEINAPSSQMGWYLRVSSREKVYRMARAEDLVARVRIL
jgi:hypothetical protein